MDIEEKLEKLRREYIKIAPPEGLAQRGFADLRLAMFEQRPPTFSLLAFFRRPVYLVPIFIILLGFFSVGIVNAAQGALPGDSLYKVKRVSEDVFVAITGDDQIKAERRSQEIFGLIKKGSESDLIEKARKEYETEVLKTKGKLERSEKKKQEQEKKLEEQQKKINELLNLDFTKEKNDGDKFKNNQELEIRGAKDKEERDQQESEGKGKEEDNEAKEDEEDRSGSNSGDD